MSATEFEAAVAELEAALTASGTAHAIIGGVAAIALGVGRGTLDVDATVSAETLELPGFLASLAKHGFVPRVKDLDAFVQQTNVLPLHHPGSGTPVDISLAFLPFEHELIAAAELRSFGAARIRVPTPTNLVIMKLIAHRPRDLDDCAHLTRLQPIDFARARRILSEFCEVLEDRSRLDTLDKLEAATRSR